MQNFLNAPRNGGDIISSCRCSIVVVVFVVVVMLLLCGYMPLLAAAAYNCHAGFTSTVVLVVAVVAV